MRWTALALLAAASSIASAGAVPVCDGVITIGAGGEALCSVAWRVVEEADLAQASTWLGGLSIESASQLIAPALGLWALAFVIRLVMHAVADTL